MKQEEITAIYTYTATARLLGLKLHRKQETIELDIKGIKIEIPITANYETIKRLIKKELTKYTFHKSLTPKYSRLNNSNLILKSSKFDKIVKQEPLLDLYS